MTKSRPTIEQLKQTLDHTKKILKLLPPGDSMYLMYDKMVTRLTDRIETYDFFYENPYSQTASQFKYNSDGELELGDYSEGSRESIRKEDE